MYLDQHGAALELSLCPLLASPLLWAAVKLMGSKQARADGMLQYSDSVIHKPLCRLEAVCGDKKEQARLGKEIVGQFKNLLGWQVYPVCTAPRHAMHRMAHRMAHRMVHRMAHRMAHRMVCYAVLHVVQHVLHYT